MGSPSTIAPIGDDFDGTRLRRAVDAMRLLFNGLVIDQSITMARDADNSLRYTLQFQPLDDTLTALAALNSTPGILVETAADTFTKRTLQAPAAGFSITNPAGVAGDPTFVLANDLAALEALSGTNTIYYRSATSTWTAVTIGSGLSFSGGTLDTAIASGSVTAANEATDSTCFICFFTDATGTVQPKTNTGLTFNSNTQTVGVPTLNASTSVLVGGLITLTGGSFSGSVGTSDAVASGVSSISANVASAGAQKWSPAVILTGSGWRTGGGGSASSVMWAMLTVPVEGTLDPTANLSFRYQLASGGYSEIMALTSAGVLSVNGSTVWTAGNDGTGSGLDADLLDGKNTGTSGNVVGLLDGNNTYSGTSDFSGVATFTNTGLHILDTNASHDLIIKPGSNITADRTLTLTTGDTDMIVDITAVTDEYVLAYDVGTNTWRGVEASGSDPGQRSWFRI